MNASKFYGTRSKKALNKIKDLEKELSASAHYPELARLQRENARLKKQLKEQKEFIAAEIENDGIDHPIPYTMCGIEAEYEH